MTEQWLPTSQQRTHPALVWTITLRWQNRSYLHPSREFIQPWCEPSPWGDRTGATCIPAENSPSLGVNHHLEMTEQELPTSQQRIHPTLVWAITLSWSDKFLLHPMQDCYCSCPLYIYQIPMLHLASVEHATKVTCLTSLPGQLADSNPWPRGLKSQYCLLDN